jgi:hypothetical protein
VGTKTNFYSSILVKNLGDDPTMNQRSSKLHLHEKWVAMIKVINIKEYNYSTTIWHWHNAGRSNSIRWDQNLKRFRVTVSSNN